MYNIFAIHLTPGCNCAASRRHDTILFYPEIRLFLN